MDLHTIPIRPYTLRLDKVSIFRYKKILSSLRKQCESEDIEIQKERISWSLLHPFTVRIFIFGICPVPEEDLQKFRSYYDNIRKESLKENKKKRQNRRKSF